MKVVFISNYINHHQMPFCEAMQARLGEDFVFIQTSPMEEERVRMGWAVDVRQIPYVHLFYEEEALCRQLIAECDLLMAGWMEDPSVIYERMASGKPALRISERIYREGRWKAISPRGLMAKYKEHIRFRSKPVWLLCNGAYVASDFALIGAYPNKKLRFGYFPAERKYSQALVKSAAEEPLKILWAGRFLPLKHPEFAVRMAEDLAAEGLSVELTMIGDGKQAEELKQQAQAAGLADKVVFPGFLAPEKVRDAMEKSDIYLFTSNHLEGWGAVVNEAMNSGCAVVASDQAGGVPYLIQNGQNGLTYANNSYTEFYVQVRRLVQDRALTKRIGAAAAETIRNEWNADTAAERVIAWAEGVAQGQIRTYESGPLSVAPCTKPPKTTEKGSLNG